MENCPQFGKLRKRLGNCPQSLWRHDEGTAKHTQTKPRVWLQVQLRSSAALNLRPFPRASY
jgi:hypothetical protein